MNTNWTVPNTNIGYLCTDWQVEQGRGNQNALIWISSSGEKKEFTFKALQDQSNQFANLLQSRGFQRGDKIMILLPRIPELFTCFLGTLKAGLNSCILFNSIGEDTLKDRIQDSNARLIITNKSFLFKIEKILPAFHLAPTVLVLDEVVNSGDVIGVKNDLAAAGIDFTTPLTSQDQPSHFHYTSGSTGRPKGVQHVHGAVKNIAESFLEVMQPDPDDLYWCTADQGWVTGVSYGIIGPWVNGITQVQLETNFNAETWMGVLEKYKITILYSAPTVFRMLMQVEDAFFARFNYSNLKRIYCVGEPLNPTIIDWGRRVLGKDIYDTWFQTETGSIMISNRPGIEIRPGSMGKPLSYIQAAILDEGGNEVQALEKGLLCLKKPWASMFAEYMNNPEVYREKFIDSYYTSGDLAFTDRDGYFWFIGRNDDVINTAGHLVSPFEVESALLELAEVNDVGVVGVPDEILFEKIIAFIVLNDSVTNTRMAEMKLKLHVSQKISSIASPKEIVFVPSIPKTKSGKVMRRVLRSRYLNEAVGDLSTLEEF